MRYYKVMNLPKVLRYIASGGIAVLANLCSFFILVHLLQTQYLAASVIAFCIGMIVSFTLHKFWTFEDKEISRVHFQLSLYLIMTSANLIINTFLVYAFVTWFGMWYMLSQTLASAIIGVISYFGYQEFVFVRQETI